MKWENLTFFAVNLPWKCSISVSFKLVAYVTFVGVTSFLNPETKERQIFCLSAYCRPSYHGLFEDSSCFLHRFRICTDSMNSFEKATNAAILKIIKVKNISGRYTAELPKFFSSHLIQRE